jgi:anthranilate synthase/aminodeoxychorismate synthase-like glutamine amidotransferase
LTLLVDNYDSFTFNLFQALRRLGDEVTVLRNDAPLLREFERLRPRRLVVSPGPGRPEDAGKTPSLLRTAMGRVPILGVCLGHQAIAQALGGRIVRARRAVHGRATPVVHDGRTVFRGLASPLEAARYHSLVVSDVGFPGALEVSARSESGEIMALRHRGLPVEGVQFHPESFLTPLGMELLRNFRRSA